MGVQESILKIIQKKEIAKNNTGEIYIPYMYSQNENL